MTGIYFAEYARYSNGDRDRGYFHVSSHSGHRQLLLCKVLCGNVKDYGGTINRELNPAKDLVDEQRSANAGFQVVFDSVRGGPHCPGHSGGGENDSRMYVVYRNDQVYPAYLVTYRKKHGGAKVGGGGGAAHAEEVHMV